MEAGEIKKSEKMEKKKWEEETLERCEKWGAGEATAAEEDDSSDTFSLSFSFNLHLFFFFLFPVEEVNTVCPPLSPFSTLFFFLTYCTVVLVPEDFEEKSLTGCKQQMERRVSPHKVMC